MRSDLHVLRVVWQGCSRWPGRFILGLIWFKLQGLIKITFPENMFQTPGIQTWSWKIHRKHSVEASTRQCYCSALFAWIEHDHVAADPHLATCSRPSRIGQTNFFFPLSHKICSKPKLKTTKSKTTWLANEPDPQSCDRSHSPRLQSSVSLRPQH